APEQAESPGQVDARSDLYSLGATLYHLLTGALPFGGTSYLQQLQQLLTCAPRPLAEVRPEVPAELATLVDRLRSRDPKARPANAEEVISLLEPFARVLSPGEDGAHWDGRRRASLVLDVLRERISVAEACASGGISEAEFDRWQQRFFEGAARALD